VSALLVLVAGAGLGVLTAPLLGRIVDIAVRHGSADAVTVPVVLLALAAIGRGVATGVGGALLARLGESMLATIREQFVARALNLPLEQIERAGAGDLNARVTNDVSVIARAVRSALPQLAGAVLTITLTLAGLAVLDWRFLLVALIAVPIQLHTVRWYVGNAIPLYATQRVAAGSQQQQLLDTVGGAHTVRALRLTPAHVDRVTRRSQAAVDLTLRGIRLLTRFYARLNLAEYVGLTGVLITGFLLVRNGTVSIGTATAAALYFHSLFNPINSALVLVDDALSANASLARLVGVTDLPAPAEPQRLARPADSSVTVVAVNHAYTSDHAVLHDVDVKIGPGERVALVGASGAGKTTLAKLAGVHQPTGGQVLLGGAGVEDLGPEVTRQNVVLISQEVHVFAGPLSDDLRLARPEATDDELNAALAQVGALSWALALPDGLATSVGDGGHRLTVTQAQQLALARLVLADPPIAILDEATADAGSAGARVLEAAADSALAGRTGLIVAHRLTQAAAANRVIVLDDGRVAEEGAHEELIAGDGRYAALWAAWSTTRSA
jgi:ATP-binding cassette subfamily C protein